jgi:hypothetical protein
MKSIDEVKVTFKHPPKEEDNLLPTKVNYPNETNFLNLFNLF